MLARTLLFDTASRRNSLPSAESANEGVSVLPFSRYSGAGSGRLWALRSLISRWRSSRFFMGSFTIKITPPDLEDETFSRQDAVHIPSLCVLTPRPILDTPATTP